MMDNSELTGNGKNRSFKVQGESGMNKFEVQKAYFESSDYSVFLAYDKFLSVNKLVVSVHKSGSSIKEVEIIEYKNKLIEYSTKHDHNIDLETFNVLKTDSNSKDSISFFCTIRNQTIEENKKPFRHFFTKKKPSKSIIVRISIVLSIIVLIAPFIPDLLLGTKKTKIQKKENNINKLKSFFG